MTETRKIEEIPQKELNRELHECDARIGKLKAEIYALEVQVRLNEATMRAIHDEFTRRWLDKLDAGKGGV